VEDRPENHCQDQPKSRASGVESSSCLGPCVKSRRERLLGQSAKEITLKGYMNCGIRVVLKIVIEDGSGSRLPTCAETRQVATSNHCLGNSKWYRCESN